ncbi:hypothetical protein ACFVRD_49760 [Streptomyces sp. NPDC057908]|uniref:LexA family protein n=1 Tax=Streptomyces sp. NPDC057908 TaxID=3346276 RepID=UPI0036EA5936
MVGACAALRTEGSAGSGTGRPTARQEAVLRVIRDVIADTGNAPTVREIGQCVGLSSPGSVAYRLGRLEKLGLISRMGGGFTGSLIRCTLAAAMTGSASAPCPGDCR